MVRPSGDAANPVPSRAGRVSNSKRRVTCPFARSKKAIAGFGWYQGSRCPFPRPPSSPKILVPPRLQLESLRRRSSAFTIYPEPPIFCVIQELSNRGWHISACGANARLDVPRYGNQEPMTDFRHSLDELGILNFFQRLAQFPHFRVDAVLEIDEGVFRPERRPELVTRNDRSVRLPQEPENLKRLLLDAHG